MARRLLSIVIVSYNTRDLLHRCLSSVVDNPRHRLVPPGSDGPMPHGGGDPEAGGRLDCELIVVDNGSPDGSAGMVREQFPGVKLVAAGENLGFARATNVGLKQAGGDRLMLLNPDTEVLEDALPTMVAFLESHPRVAAVGPSLVYADGRPQHAAFRFPNLWMSLFDFFTINHRFVDSRLNGRYPHSRDGAPFPIDHPLGAAIVLRREALDEIGYLDESFFIYCEEVDWCIRARKLGWSVYQLPGARVVHHGGQSTGQFRQQMFVALHRSRHQLFRKHYSPAFVAMHRAITRAGLLRRAVPEWWSMKKGRMARGEWEERLEAYRTIWGM